MIRAILQLDDTAHSIALGTAIGFFIAWTPTVGIHMILVVAVAVLLRANKVAGLIAVYLSNPITVAPMYYLDYWLGAQVLHNKFTFAEMQALLDYHGWDGFKRALWTLCVELAGPMWLGGLVLAIGHAIPGYYITRWAVERYRRRSPVTAVGAAAQTPASPPVDHSPVTTNQSPFE
jgi:uncharacterized protein (DUF2062 family)